MSPRAEESLLFRTSIKERFLTSHRMTRLVGSWFGLCHIDCVFKSARGSRWSVGIHATCYSGLVTGQFREHVLIALQRVDVLPRNKHVAVTLTYTQPNRFGRAESLAIGIGVYILRAGYSSSDRDVVRCYVG